MNGWTTRIMKLGGPKPEEQARRTFAISEVGVDLILEFEGVIEGRLPDGRYCSYLCPAGVWTIYAGCTHGVVEGLTETEQECRRRFAAELSDVQDAVNRMVNVEITQAQFDALVSLAYNIGWPTLKSSTLMRKLNEGDHAGAAGRFNDFRKARVRGETARRMGVPDGTLVTLQGLVRRRAAEADLFLSDIPVGVEMVQAVGETPVQVTAVDASKGAAIVGSGAVAVAQVSSATTATDVASAAAPAAAGAFDQVKDVAGDVSMASGVVKSFHSGVQVAVAHWEIAAVVAVLTGGFLAYNYVVRRS